jgi:hypothetical protein
MLHRKPDLPRHMAGGPDNSLGARAIYLGASLYRIHGSNEPDTIGQARIRRQIGTLCPLCWPPSPRCDRTPKQGTSSLEDESAAGSCRDTSGGPSFKLLQGDAQKVSERGCSFDIALAIAACHCAVPGRYAARRCFSMILVR